MVNSRQKGKRGELEVAHILKEHGFDARRGQQYAGANGDADVVGLDGIHIEVKRTERLDLKAAFTQSVRDAREGEVPTVWSKRNNGPWLVTMSAEDFLKMYTESLKTETGA